MPNLDVPPASQHNNQAHRGNSRRQEQVVQTVVEPPSNYVNNLPPMPQEQAVYSEEMDEILTQMPNAITRWGITVVTTAVGILLLLSWIVQYPDVVRGRVRLNATQAPVTLAANQAGQIRWLVPDAAKVSEMQAIAYFQNPAKYEQVMELKSVLAQLQGAVYNGSRISSHSLNSNWQLGELQTSFHDLKKSIQQSSLIGNNRQMQGMQSQVNNEQIAQYNAIIEKQKQQINIAQQEYRQIEGQINNRYRPLYESGAIAKADLERYENDLLQIQKNIENFQANIHQTETQILTLRGKQQEYGYQQSSENINYQSNIIQAFSTLQSQVGIWEQKYVLKSPVNGTLQQMPSLENNSNVNAQQELAVVIPESGGTASYVGELVIPSEGSGKVAVGQLVQISLDDFNKKEYGMLLGEVSHILPINTQNTYNVAVSLPNGLQTTHHIAIAFKHGMQGEANIITKKQRFITRIFNQLSSLFE